MRTPAASAALTACGARGVEVADEHVDAEPERRGMLEARVGRDHERARRQRPHLGGVRRRPAAHDQGAPRCCRRRLHAPSVPGSRRARGHAGRSAARRGRAARGAARARRRRPGCDRARARRAGGERRRVGLLAGRRGAPDRAQGRRRGGPRDRGGDGAPRRRAGGAGGRVASARAPSSHSSPPTARARSPAIAVPRASSARTTSTRACWSARASCTSPATRCCANRAPRQRCGWRKRPGATVLA